MKKSKKLFMASEVRSGSTYAAEIFAYSIFENMQIQFWDLAKESFSSLSDSDGHDKIEEIISKLWINEAGFLSAKIMCAQLSVIYREAKKNSLIYDEMFGIDSYWITIRRRDRLSQAVSLACARNDGIFHSYVKNEEISRLYLQDSEIDDAFKAIALSDDYLRAFSGVPENCKYFFYEDIVKSPSSFIVEVAKFLEIPIQEIGFVVAEPKLSRRGELQKVERTEQFRDWFLRNYHKTD